MTPTHSPRANVSSRCRKCRWPTVKSTCHNSTPVKQWEHADGESTESLAYTETRARKHYRQIRYEQGATADLKILRCPVKGKEVVRQRTWRLGGGALRLTARGTPKRSARFFLRSSSSGSIGPSGAPRFLAGCFLFSADASTPKRSALAFSFTSSCSIS